MTLEEAIAIIDTALKPERLSDLQELVFRQAWLGKTYQEMAVAAGYDPDYIRLVGFQLWQALSQALGEKITKNNFRSILRQYAAADSTTANLVEASAEVCLQEPKAAAIAPPQVPVSLELPEGPVSLDSPFYVERPPIESRCYEEIVKPGALIRVRAPSQTGKTSLKNRILDYAARQGYHTVRLNFDQIDESSFSHLNQFLRWFCANITQQLNLESRLDQYWNEDVGVKVSCTVYFQTYVLEQLERPIVLALDEVNRLFEYPELAQNFLPLLRSWYEEAKDMERWQKLRMVVVHSTEIYVPLNLNQSPFNVGLAIRLPEFTQAQVQTLAQRHGLEWTQTDTEHLMAMVGGHPYRVRLALYHLGRREATLAQILQAAPTSTGIYSHHLRYHWITLQTYPELMSAMKHVVREDSSDLIDPIAAYKLESMGLIKVHQDKVVNSCQLYCLYFRSRLT